VNPAVATLASGSRAAKKKQTREVLGQQSWALRASNVEAYLTQRGGHLAPVRFRIGDRWVEPFEVAPWAKERVDASIPQVLRVMRGDFFCMPFGGNEQPYKGEIHPPHGETANGKWHFESSSRQQIHLSLRTSVRPGRVDKIIQLADGQATVYSQHVVSGMEGPMSLGHHPILKVPEGVTARVSVSPFRFGQVFPGQMEDPTQGGYSILKPGGRFSTLSRVPRMDGKWTDLSVYPDREGYEDLVLISSNPDLNFAWTALTVPEMNYVWFSLKDPRVLPSTVFWMSNGGRHYAPWNGRHRRAIGLEEIAGNFHYGLAESAERNSLNRAGIATCARLDAQRPLTVNYIMAVAEIPEGFDIVESIVASQNEKSVVIRSKSGKTTSAELNLPFLFEGPIHS
jgi:hypothetical protein